MFWQCLWEAQFCALHHSLKIIQAKNEPKMAENIEKTVIGEENEGRQVYQELEERGYKWEHQGPLNLVS